MSHTAWIQAAPTIHITQPCANAANGCTMQVETTLAAGDTIPQPRPCISCHQAQAA